MKTARKLSILFSVLLLAYILVIIDKASNSELVYFNRDPGDLNLLTESGRWLYDSPAHRINAKSAGNSVLINLEIPAGLWKYFPFPHIRTLDSSGPDFIGYKISAPFWVSKNDLQSQLLDELRSESKFVGHTYTLASASDVKIRMRIWRKHLDQLQGLILDESFSVDSWKNNVIEGLNNKNP